jgi:hypothetical protein
MGEAAEGIVIGLEMPQHGPVAVDVQRGPVFFGKCPDRDVLGIKFIPLVCEKVHSLSPDAYFP